MGYRFDTRHLPPQTQQIINKRDENDKNIRKSSQTKVANQDKTIYPICIFMRLGCDSSTKYNGIETMCVYEKFCTENGSVWFSTDSLASGMSEKKRTEFINSIKNGYVVEIYFVIGKNGGGNNDIQYMAEVLDIKTDAESMASPEKVLTPIEWKDDKNKIWIKIKSLKPCSNPTTSGFVVANTGNVLAKSIANSQYHFGYIRKK